MVNPFIISVKADEEAMALAHPNVLNFASSILPSASSLKVKVSASPQAREPTSPLPLASSISPTLRGFKK